MKGSREQEPKSVWRFENTSESSARTSPNWVITVGVQPRPRKSYARFRACARETGSTLVESSCVGLCSIVRGGHVKGSGRQAEPKRRRILILFDAVIYMQESQPHKRFLLIARCSSISMRLARHLTALRAGCKQCPPGLPEPDMPNPGIVGMRGSVAVRLRPCMTSSTPARIGRPSFCLPE